MFVEHNKIMIGEIKKGYVNQYIIFKVTYGKILRYIFPTNNFFLILYLKYSKFRKFLGVGGDFYTNC